MPQLNPLVLTDRATPSVDHTFNPRDVTGGVATLVESTGVPIGDKRVTMALTRTTQGRYKASVKFVVPVVQNATVDGVSRPTIVRSAYADLTLSFDQTSTREERNNLVGMLADLLGESNPLVTGVLVELQGIY